MRLPLRINEHPEGDKPVASWSWRIVTWRSSGSTCSWSTASVTGLWPPPVVQSASWALIATS